MKALQKVMHVLPRSRDLEQELYVAQIDLARASRAAALMQLPANPVADLRDAFGLSKTTYHALKSAGLGPPTFKLGRRYYVKTADWTRWLEAQPVSSDPAEDEGEEQ